MRIAALVIAAVALAACSPAQRTQLREFFNVDAPTLARDAGIDGQTVMLKRGQALVVRLPEDPSTGMRWEMSSFTPASVTAPVLHDLVARPGTDPATPNVAGEALFRMRGASPGTQAITLEYRRPFEAVAKTVRFDVVVL